jgi:hypothetical protein
MEQGRSNVEVKGRSPCLGLGTANRIGRSVVPSEFLVRYSSVRTVIRIRSHSSLQEPSSSHQPWWLPDWRRRQAGRRHFSAGPPGNLRKYLGRNRNTCVAKRRPAAARIPRHTPFHADCAGARPGTAYRASGGGLTIYLRMLTRHLIEIARNLFDTSDSLPVAHQPAAHASRRITQLATPQPLGRSTDHRTVFRTSL